MAIARRVTAHVLSLILVAAPAFAWGPDGHRAVARIADARLTPAAKAAIQSLLGNETLVDVAVWADEVRNTTHPATYNWHFTDVPITARGFLRSRDCKPNAEKGDCSVAALERLSAVLRDSSRPELERREALKFIVHIIGDIHQPLHSAERNHDEGGNRVTVTLAGEMINLHAAWDRRIIALSNENETTLAHDAEDWLETQSEQALARGSFIDWTNEGQRLSRAVVYRQANDHVISTAERVEAIGIIRKRLARAGVRLARVLNEALSK
jgi:nuclease S1